LRSIYVAITLLPRHQCEVYMLLQPNQLDIIVNYICYIVGDHDFLGWRSSPATDFDNWLTYKQVKLFNASIYS